MAPSAEPKDPPSSRTSSFFDESPPAPPDTWLDGQITTENLLEERASLNAAIEELAPKLGLPRTNLQDKQRAKHEIFLDQLSKTWQIKEEHAKRRQICDNDRGNESTPKPRQPNATLRKRDLTAEVTAEDEEMIQRIVGQKQKTFQEFERKQLEMKTAHVKTIHPHVTDAEVAEAIKICDGDEGDVAARLTDPEFLGNIRMLIACDGVSSPPPKGRIRTFKRKDKGNSNYKRLRLDDALANRHSMEGWSEARRRAYKLIDSNPNAYYYRFNAPGDPQKNGKWSEEEKKLFFKRKEEVGVTGKWGIFAMEIPGRVGYQCSNFYRNLIESGEVQDSQYVIDAKGKAHFVFGNGSTRSFSRKPKPTSRAPKSDESKSKSKKPKRKRRNDDDDYLDPEDYEYRPSAKRGAPAEDAMPEQKVDNPLPDYVDPITLEKVEEPFLSPFGHVMDRKTWGRVLMREPRNICPFTKNKLHKRDLIRLTHENIEEHRSKIVNFR